MRMCNEEIGWESSALRNWWIGQDSNSLYFKKIIQNFKKTGRDFNNNEIIVKYKKVLIIYCKGFEPRTLTSENWFETLIFLTF